MGRSGAKPKGKIRIQWSPEFAYAIGLLATDGNLGSHRKYIAMVSKDREQIENFCSCLGIDNQISVHYSGSTKKTAWRVQFGDVRFYNFLLSIGLTPRKSKTIHKVKIPKKFFVDFLRGHFDGDGSVYSYWDPRWRSSFMVYVELVSASRRHIQWLQKQNFRRLGIEGRITKSKSNSCYRLKYAKRESIIFLKKIYASPRSIALTRKKLKSKRVLGILGLSL